MKTNHDDQLEFTDQATMDKIQEIADRIFRSTPEIARQTPNDSILKQNSKVVAYTNPNATKLPHLSKVDSNGDLKKSATTQLPNKKGSNANPNPNIKPDLSVVDWQKRYNELNVQLAKEREQNLILKQELDNRQERYVKRELEYRKIIEELQEELRQKCSLDFNEKRHLENIAGQHAKIMEHINTIQMNTSKVLLDQEKDIIRFFNNKISEIKKQFEEEKISRGKKDKNFMEKENQLIAELEWIKDIAQKIDNENHSLMKKYMELKAQYSTQEKDREILLREILLKKKKNAILTAQIEQYEKILKDAVKDGFVNTNLANQLLGENSSKSPGKSLLKSVNLSQNMNDTENSVLNRSDGMQDPMQEQMQDQMLSQKYNSLSAARKSLQNSRISSPGQNKRAETIITNLKNAYQREKKNSQKFKALYIKELENRTEFETILKKCIDDIKEQIIQSQQNTSKRFGATGDLDRAERAKLIEKLISDEKILTLIYDKTFFGQGKKIEIPAELLKDDSDEEDFKL